MKINHIDINKKSLRVPFNQADFQVIYTNKKDILVSGKRLFDLIVSLIVIVCLLSWILPLLAIIIKLDSRGPVLFQQKRLGANGRIFKCFKLRSMYVNAQANTEQAKINDRRITRFGSFLRNTCLDELPQFFNVLMGDMSIVGPRPHMIKDCNDFSKLVGGYELRHLVKPGITGMAQVKGYRGETKDYFDVAHRYKWDMFYVKNQTFLLDIQIIHKTYSQILAAVMKKEKHQLSKHYVTVMPKQVYPDQLAEA